MDKQLIKKLAPSLFIVLFAVAVLLVTPSQINDPQNSMMGPRAVPYFCCIGLILCSLAQMVLDWVRYVREKVGRQEKEHEKESLDKGRVLRVIGFFACIVLWIILVPLIGYPVTTFLITAAAMCIMGNRKPVVVLLTSLLMSAGCWLVFIRLLNVPI